MNESHLARLFAHNNWANGKLIGFCEHLTDAQLDAEASAVTKGTIRETLQHIVAAQENYAAILQRIEHRFKWEGQATFGELRVAANLSGEDLLRLVGEPNQPRLQELIYMDDGFVIEPWVVLLQALNHATEHREQIKSMLSDQGLTPPRIDGWQYGRFTKGLIDPKI